MHYVQFFITFLLCALHPVLTIRTQSTAASQLMTKPVIRDPPKDIYSTTGVLEFSCQADGVPKPKINWHEASTGDLVVDQTPSGGTSPGIHMNQHYGRLMVSNPIRGTVYSFYCNASNSQGWVISEPPVKGALAFIDNRFRITPMDKNVFEGSRVVLECIPPEGIPTPKLYWLKNGETINAPEKSNETSRMRIFIKPPGGLQINSVILSDTGIYTCVAKNLAGESRSTSAHLQVKPKIHFTETPQDARVRVGSDVKFRCRVEGNRLVQWSKDEGHGIIDSSRSELADGYLLLKNVQQSDAGVYVCTAPGSLAAKALLTVETPPTFARTPDDLTLHEGETAIFHCVTTGFPKPSIYWELPDKTPLFPSERDETVQMEDRFILHSRGFLEIRNVQVSDSGRYQCTAHSSVDRIHTSANLKVIPGKHNNSNAESGQTENANMYSDIIFPIIGLPPANQTRFEGDAVTMDCELGISRPETPSMHNVYQPPMVYKEPSKKVTWKVEWHRALDGTNQIALPINLYGPEREQRYNLLPGGSLQIYDVKLSDTGAYTCNVKAENEDPIQPGERLFKIESNWTAHLTVYPRGSPITTDITQENPLSPPRNVRVINITSTTITITWEHSRWVEADPLGPDRLTKIDNHVAYWVEFYRPDLFTDGWQIVEENWRANVMKIGNLQPETAYYFLIRPRVFYRRVGWASAPVGPVFTLPYQPRSHEIQEAKISIPLLNKDLINTIKNVEIKNIHLQALTPQSVKVSWQVHEKPDLLVLLSGYTIYYRSVSILQCVAVNMGETNPKITETSYSANDYCSLKLVDLYNRLQQMQRLLKDSNQSDASIQSLNVRAQFMQNEALFNTDQQITYERSGMVRELKPFHCYEISVKANLAHDYLGKIEGRESFSRSILTYESFPSAAPAKIAVQWITDQDVELSWELPPVDEWNGLLLGFVIYVYDDSALRHETFNVSIAERRTRIRGLVGKVTYLLQIAAATCKGVGVRSKALKLNPQFRKKGLGVGWLFDELTGHRIDAITNHGHSLSPPNSNALTNQPWFIGLMISSLILWCLLIIIVVYCCRRQRMSMQKSNGAVLLSNKSNSGSNVGDISLNQGNATNSKKMSKLYTGACAENQVLMKPLLARSDAENSYPIINSCTILSSTEEQQAYGLYSIANGDSQWSQYTGDTMPNRSTLYHNNITVKENPTCFPSAQEIHNRMVSQMNVDMTHLISGRSGTIANSIANKYVSNCSPILSTYLTYQPTMIPLSQSINEFQQNLASQESQGCYPACTGMIGQCANGVLPIIAPVTQLTNHTSQLPQGAELDFMEPSSSSVTPYATASIVNPRLKKQPQVIARMNENKCDVVWNNFNGRAKMHESQNESVNGTSSSSEGSTSYRSSCHGGTDKCVYQPEDRCYQMIQSHEIQGINLRSESSAEDNHLSNRYHRANTPLRLHNVIPTDNRTISSNKSKSESTGSNKTGLSDLSGYTHSKMRYDPSNQALNCSISPQTCSTHLNNIDGSVYSLIDESIPPPPASPPPPAPIIQSHSRMLNGLCHPELPLLNSENDRIYDANAESTEDEREDKSNLPGFARDQNEVCGRMGNDRNSTYTRVC